MTESEWLEANAQYLSAAVAWVRALLDERAPPEPSVTPPHEERGPGWFRPHRHKPLLTTTAGSAAAEAAMLAAAEATSPPAALPLLANRLGLNRFEQSALLLCIAVELDTSIAGLCARALRDPARPFPTFALAFALFEDPAWDALSPERPLRHLRLIEVAQPSGTPLTVSPIRADERIVNFVKGVTYLDDRLTALVSPIPPPGGDVPASQRETAQLALHRWRAITPGVVPPPIQLLGADGASKRLVASLIGAELGRRPLRLDAPLLPTAPADLESLARLWQREAQLLPVALYLDTDTIEPAQAGAVDRLLARLSGLAFLATRHLWPGSVDAPIAVEVEKPTPAEQSACWAAALGEQAGDLPDQMAAQFNLAAAAIRELAQRATAEAAEDDRGAPDRPSLHDRLWDAARELSRPRLDTLARRLIPRAGWDDIVLPAAEAALLHSIADQVGNRSKVYREWGFAERMSRGLGISVLFAGASGTGKTMAAEVLASHLRLDLFRIDLSTVVSKYLGETEANLRRLFDAAEEGGTILFFDEADALFGKRTEVKVRSVPARNQTLQRARGLGPAAGATREADRAGTNAALAAEALRSPGRPLDPATRAYMEPRFGYDFSNVRVHTDETAARAARSIDAVSYTAGTDIGFGSGRYAPDTPMGRELLAHELTHVVQQSHASPSTDTPIAAPDSASEREAASSARQVAGGGVLDRPVSAVPVSVQRLSTGAAVGLGIGAGILGLAGILAGIVGIDTAVRESRGLDETERKEAFRVFGNSLDYDKVRVAEDPIMSIGGYARTPGNTIYFLKGTTQNKDASPELRAWYYPFLIHEMTHTWQTQHGVSKVRKIFTALRGHSAYNYDGPHGLKKAKAAGGHFVDFNTEQQASICGDYAKILIAGGGDPAPYEPFIAEVKNGGKPVEEPQPQPGNWPGASLPAGQAYA